MGRRVERPITVTHRGLVAAVTMVLLAGCAPSPPAVSVRIGSELIARVEVARSLEDQRNGLAGRDDVAGGGMLFLFEDRERREVWMAGVLVSLDVAWIVDEAVAEIRTLEPCTVQNQDQCERWRSPVPVDALLEVPAGTLAGIRVGTPVEVLEGGS